MWIETIKKLAKIKIKPHAVNKISAPLLNHKYLPKSDLAKKICNKSLCKTEQIKSRKKMKQEIYIVSFRLRILFRPMKSSKTLRDTISKYILCLDQNNVHMEYLKQHILVPKHQIFKIDGWYRRYTCNLKIWCSRDDV